ncbi:MAG: hypothetical protein JSS22_06040 [Proteobacteria bacterium]|nr:hypothetical protein [Pseudomonadota bacterium]
MIVPDATPGIPIAVIVAAISVSIAAAAVAVAVEISDVAVAVAVAVAIARGHHKRRKDRCAEGAPVEDRWALGHIVARLRS